MSLHANVFSKKQLESTQDFCKDCKDSITAILSAVVAKAFTLSKDGRIKCRYCLWSRQRKSWKDRTTNQSNNQQQQQQQQKYSNLKFL